MAKNEYKKPAPAPKVKKAKKIKIKKPKISSGSSIGKFLQSIIDGNFLARENFIKSIPFLGFITFIAIMYIANTFIAEKTIRDIETTKLKIKELRSEYIAIKSEVMFGRKQSIVAKKVAPADIKEAIVPPKKIVDKRTTNKKDSIE